MKAGDKVWVHHVSLGYEGDDPDIIGSAVVLAGPVCDVVRVLMDEPVNHRRDYLVQEREVAVEA